MNKCSACDSNDWIVLEDTASMVRKRCSACGHEQVTLVSPGDDPVLPQELEPVFTLMARWSRAPSMDQINQLKAGLPLMAHSKDDLLSSARMHKQFDLGRFTESELRFDAALFEALGLELERIPVTRR